MIALNGSCVDTHIKPCQHVGDPEPLPPPLSGLHSHPEVPPPSPAQRQHSVDEITVRWQELLDHVAMQSQEIDHLKHRVSILEEFQPPRKRSLNNSRNLDFAPVVGNQSDSPTVGTSRNSTVGKHDLMLEAKNELSRVHVLSFSPSIWDACIMVRLGILGPRSLAMLFFCYLLTIGFQGYFIYATSKATTGYDAELVNDIRMWRVKYGHDIDFASTDSDRPLASIVCQEFGRASEIAGGQQMEILKEMQRYRSDGGITLSILAVCMWSFCCLKELLNLMFFQVGITNAAIETWKTEGPDACTGVHLNRQRNFEISSITWQRALCMGLFVTLPRLIILIFLGFYGIRFLMGIQEIEEIIMNAVALEVILGVDELIFAAMAPAVVQGLLEGLEVMRVEKGKVAASCLPVARFVFVVTVVGSTIAYYSLPLLHIMDQVEFEMCDGYTDFVARQDLTKQYTLWVGDTSNAGNTDTLRGDESALFRHKGVLQATVVECQRQNQRMADIVCHDRRGSLPGSATQFENVADIFNVPTFYVPADPTEQVKVGIWRGEEVVDVRSRAEGAYCYDFDLNPHTSISEKTSIRMAITEQLRGLKFKPERCADLQHLCRKAAHWSSQLNFGNLVRFACPVTCGCDNPASGLFHAHEMYGCPSVCRFKYERSLQVLPCVDLSDDVAALEEYQRSYEDLFYYDAVIKKYTAEGTAIPISCSSWAESSSILHTRNWSIGAVSACNDAAASILWEYGLRSVRPLCPVTCGCLANPQSPECPGSCSWHAAGINITGGNQKT